MARKRLLFFHRIYSVLKQVIDEFVAFPKSKLTRSTLIKFFPFVKAVWGKDKSFLTRNILQTKTIFILLFVTAFCLTQGFAGFLGTGILPVVAQLPAAMTIVQNSPNQNSLLDQGKALYDAGKFSEAVTVLQQAVATFKDNGDSLKQAVTLSNLSLAYQQLGLWADAETAITESLKILQTGEISGNYPNDKILEKTKLLAQTLDIHARLQLSLGKAEQALETWQKATTTYAQVGNSDGVTKSKLNQAQALQNLGFYPKACKSILDALEINNQDCKISPEQIKILKEKPESLLNAQGLRRLGDILQLIGDLTQAEEILQQSLKIATALQSPADISATNLSLGNTTRALQKQKNNKNQETLQNALKFYRDAANQATSSTIKIRAQLNQLSLLVEKNQLSAAQALVPEITSQIASLPPNQAAVYARINLAQSLIKLSNSQANQNEAAQQLSRAIQLSKTLGDERMTAYALGNLAGLYEQTNQLSEATNLTNQALLLAQTVNSPDIAYRWQWQLGRLLKAQKERQKAIAAYDSAIKTLKSLRGDLVSINPDVQFSFRESVEPVYREFVELLLEPQSDKSNEEKELEQARDVIESLQLAELDNFFREDCLNGIRVQIDKVDPQAAVIYPIVLKDRLDVVVSLPNPQSNNQSKTQLRHYSINVSQKEAEDVFARLRTAISSSSFDPNRSVAVPESLRGVLTPFIEDAKRDGPVAIAIPRPGFTNAPPASVPYIRLAQKVYKWLIESVENELATSNTKTLVFVLDGPLLNIPMAILHDGKQFLVEKYAIALTPGLQLLDAQKPLPRVKLSALKGGLSQASPVSTFPPLPYVEKELNQLELEAKISGKRLLNQEFTSTAIKNAIDSVPFPIVHLATHGQFSSNAEDTFILTWDERLNVSELSNTLRAREEKGRGAIELLVLSACQTATGDKRAALGLAGVAVKAGARSTLATLWSVSDEATATLMTQFYKELSDPNITKAEALKRAQVALLKSSNSPELWAPYVLVGNWL